jgi:sugar-specific transcriptional regulator TrmB
MIVQNTFLKKIKDFGLNSYEAKLWTALLSRGISTAGELSDIANVPRSRSYDVLESLEKKGFIVMKLGKPIKYIAVSPEEVLERVKKKIKNDAQRQMDSMDSLRDSEILKELTLLHSQGVELVDPADMSGSVRGRNHIYDHVDMMIKSAEKSAVIVTSEEGLIRKADFFKKSMKKAAERGVDIRIAAPVTKKSKTAIQELKGIAKVKHMDKLKARFVIVDGKEMTFMLLDDDNVHPTYDVGIWVNTQLFCSAILSMFDVAWKVSKDATAILKE